MKHAVNRRTLGRRAVSLLVLAALAGTARGNDAPSESGQRPAALAIGSDGTRAEAIVTEAGSRLRIRGPAGDDSTEIDLPGSIRDLLFSADAERIYVLHHRSAKRGAGTVQLITVDRPWSRTGRGPQLPPSAAGLALWPEGGSLLVGCRGEIRTLRLPDLRSGPLFRVPGWNRAVDLITGSLILVGQDDRVLLVDLTDHPGREAMPIRDTASVPAPVVELAVGAGADFGLGRLADGRLLALQISPLAAENGGTGSIATLRAEPPPTSWPTTLPAPPPPPLPEPSAPPAIETDMPALEPAHEEIVAADSPSGLPETAPAATGGDDEIPPPPPVLVAPASGVAGRVGGPEAGRVLHVALFGPDNLLREAARVALDAEGLWRVAGLPPGRYRVQLDAGGGRVVVSEPRFVEVEIPSAGGVLAGELQAVRVVE